MTSAHSDTGAGLSTQTALSEPGLRVVRNFACVLDEALTLVSGRSDETGRMLRALIKNKQAGFANSRYHPLGLFNRDDYARLGGEELAVLAETVFAQAEHALPYPLTTSSPRPGPWSAPAAVASSSGAIKNSTMELTNR